MIWSMDSDEPSDHKPMYHQVITKLSITVILCTVYG